MGSRHKSVHLTLEFPEALIIFPTYFLLYINDLSDDVICNTAINADDI